MSIIKAIKSANMMLKCGRKIFMVSSGFRNFFRFCGNTIDRVMCCRVLTIVFVFPMALLLGWI